MMFFFAYVGSLDGSSSWPIDLIHATEAAFVVVTFVCILLAVILRSVGMLLMRGLVALIGGVSASFGLIMPLELAPFFFDARGEIMMATIALILVYPIAVALFIHLFWKFMNGTPVTPPPLPSQ